MFSDDDSTKVYIGAVETVDSIYFTFEVTLDFHSRTDLDFGIVGESKLVQRNLWILNIHIILEDLQNLNGMTYHFETA